MPKRLSRDEPNEIVRDLLNAHHSGGVKKLALVYLDQADNLVYRVSGNFKTSEYAYAVAVLQADLLSLVEKT